MKKLFYLSLLVILVLILFIPVSATSDISTQASASGSAYPMLPLNTQIEVSFSDIAGFDTPAAVYLFTVPTSGEYTLGHINTWRLNLGGNPVFLTDGSLYDYDSLSPIDTAYYSDGTYGYVYYLEAGTEYFVSTEAGYHHTEKTYLRLDQGRPEKNIWTFGTTLNVNISSPGEEKVYYFSVPETGKYIIEWNSDNKRNSGYVIYDKTGNRIEGTAYHDYYNYYAIGYAYEFEAGREYRLVASSDIVCPLTFRIEKPRKLQSAKLHVFHYDFDYGTILVLKTDPVYAYLDGLTWSVSDPSIAQLDVYDFPHNYQVKATFLREGTVTVYAQIGDERAEYVISSSLDVPALELNQTQEFVGWGIVAQFTPSESGTYEFTVDPDRVLTAFSIFDSKDRLVYNAADFSETHIARVHLTKGVRYEIYKDAYAECTIALKCISTDPAGSTPPPDDPQQPGDTPPTQNTEPDNPEPNQPSDPGSSSPVTPGAGQSDNVIISGSVAIVDEGFINSLVPDPDTNTVVFNIADDNVKQLIIHKEAFVKIAAAQYNVTFAINGITLTLPASSFDHISQEEINGDITLSTNILRSEDLPQQQRKALEQYNVTQIISVDFACSDRVFHSLGSDFAVISPSVALESGKQYKAIYIADDGSVEMLGEFTDGIRTNHFSVFAIISEPQEPENVFWQIAIPVIAIIIAASVATILILRKKKTA